MTEMRKITVNLPAHLVDAVVAASGKGLTETLKEALEAHERRLGAEKFLSLRGKVKFSLSYEQLAGKDDDR